MTRHPIHILLTLLVAFPALAGCVTNEQEGSSITNTEKLFYSGRGTFEGPGVKAEFRLSAPVPVALETLEVVPAYQLEWEYNYKTDTKEVTVRQTRYLDGLFQTLAIDSPSCSKNISECDFVHRTWAFSGLPAPLGIGWTAWASAKDTLDLHGTQVGFEALQQSQDIIYNFDKIIPNLNFAQKRYTMTYKDDMTVPISINLGGGIVLERTSYEAGEPLLPIPHQGPLSPAETAASTEFQFMPGEKEELPQMPWTILEAYEYLRDKNPDAAEYINKNCLQSINAMPVAGQVNFTYLPGTIDERFPAFEFSVLEKDGKTGQIWQIRQRNDPLLGPQAEVEEQNPPNPMNVCPRSSPPPAMAISPQEAYRLVDSWNLSHIESLSAISHNYWVEEGLYFLEWTHWAHMQISLRPEGAGIVTPLYNIRFWAVTGTLRDMVIHPDDLPRFDQGLMKPISP